MATIAIESNHNDPLTRREIFLASIVLLVSVLGPFTLDSYIPSLPWMTQYFGTTPQVMQWTIGVYLFSYSLAQLVFGPFSDRFGRRPIILWGIGITLAGSVLCVCATSVPMLLLGRFIQGIGIAAPNSLAKSIMRDVFSGVRLAKIGSYTNMIFAIVPAIAPVVGGFVQHYIGWRANFMVISLLVLVVGIIIFFALPETNRHRNPHATKLSVVYGNYMMLAKSRVFIGFTLCTGLASTGIIAYATVSPFLLQTELGVTSRLFGMLSTVIAIGFVVGSYLNIRVLRHHGIHNTMFVGMGLMATSGLVMLLFGLLGKMNVAIIVLPTLTFVIGARFIFSNAVAAAFTPFPKIAGVASGFYGTVQMFCTCVGSFFLSGFHPGTQVPFAAVLLAIGVLSFLVLKYWVMPAESKKTQHLAT